MNEFKKMSSGLLYNSSHKDLKRPHMKGLCKTQKFNKIPAWQQKRRERAFNRLIPSSKGKGTGVFSPFYCEYGVNITLGKECFFNYNCTLLDCAEITLGDGVWLGANVCLATPSHPFIAEERFNSHYIDGYHDLEYAKPITIGSRCWICSGATICGGVTIGEDTIIAAGAVVTHDIPSGVIAAGVPAKVIREITKDDRIDVWETYISGEIPLSRREKSGT